MKILTPDLMGGFGNQLFIIFSSYGLSKKYGYELRIPDKTLNNQIWTWYGYIFERDIKICDGKEEYNRTITETNHENIEYKLNSVDGNVKIHGYLQKYIYFINCVDELRSILFKSIGDFFMDSDITFHIRGGDYIKYLAHHTNLGFDYYKASFKFINSYCDVNNEIIVVSDDLERAEFIMKKLSVSLNEKLGPKIAYNMSGQHYEYYEGMLTDFGYLCTSRVLVIANSTFSLMAAILNNHEKKVVFCPDESIWFGPANQHLSTENMIPDNFLRIKKI